MTHFEDFDRDKRKSHIKNNKKQKNLLSEDQKFANKAKKAFKNRIREIKEDELLDDIDYYEQY